MSPAVLDRLVAQHMLEPKPPDPARVRSWLERSRKDVHLASTVLADADPTRAMAVVYEAGYRACAGLLDLAGYRVTSQPGHHRAAIDGAQALLGENEHARLMRLDRARRFRNDTLYGDVPTAGRAQLVQLIRDAEWLVGRLEHRLGLTGAAPSSEIS